MASLVLASAVPRQLQRVAHALGTLGFNVQLVRSSAQVWRTLMHDRVRAIVVDSSACTPELDPWRLTRELCLAAPVQVILLTRPGRNKDRLRAFRAGVGSCLSLPVTAEELAACLDCVSLQNGVRRPYEQEINPPVYADTTVQISIADRKITREGNEYSISPREAIILGHLFDLSGKFVKASELSRMVWHEYDGQRADQRLKIYISMLRRKIELDPRQPRYIITRRGFGYSFVPQNGHEKKENGDGQSELVRDSQQTE